MVNHEPRLHHRLPDPYTLWDPGQRTLSEDGLKKNNDPVVATSANPEGMPPAQTIAEAKKYFGDKIDHYIAGGKLTGSPSRLISLLGNKPRVLRK